MGPERASVMYREEGVRGGAERGRTRGKEADTQRQQVSEQHRGGGRRRRRRRRRRNQSERNSVAAVRRDTNTERERGGNTERPEGKKAICFCLMPLFQVWARGVWWAALLFPPPSVCQPAACYMWGDQSAVALRIDGGERKRGERGRAGIMLYRQEEVWIERKRAGETKGKKHLPGLCCAAVSGWCMGIGGGGCSVRITVPECDSCQHLEWNLHVGDDISFCSTTPFEIMWWFSCCIIVRVWVWEMRVCVCMCVNGMLDPSQTYLVFPPIVVRAVD